MKKLIYLFLSLLLVTYACSSSDNGPFVIPQTPADLLTPLTTAQAKTPAVLFADIQKIEKGGDSPVIAQTLINYINAVPEGASIHVSIYLFEYKPILLALRKAYLRKVNLNVMLDYSARSNNQGTINEINSWGDDIHLVKIKNDASASAINHNKFVLFSEVATEDQLMKNVVFQTSHNFEEVSLKKIQDALIFSDSELYGAYLNYWNEMKSLASAGMKNYTYTEYNSSSGDLSAYFYPKRKNGDPFGEDTFIEILDNITDPSATTITIGMSDWTDSRISILNKLDDLLSQGATIEIITKTSNKGPAILSGLKDLKDKGAYVKIFNTSQINIHMKTMLIEGNYKNADHKIVITGTQNFTINALYNNNETTLILTDHVFFPQYKAYFSELKKLPGV